MPGDAQTLQPETPTDLASPVPAPLYFALWFPVVAVIAWGLMLIMGRRPWEIAPAPLVVPAPDLDGEPADDPDEPRAS